KSSSDCKGFHLRDCLYNYLGYDVNKATEHEFIDYQSPQYVMSCHAPYPNIGFAAGPYSEPAGYQDNPSDQEPKYNRNGNFTSLQYSDKYVRHAFIRKTAGKKMGFKKFMVLLFVLISLIFPFIPPILYFEGL
ncbi:uncharacterized protein DC041_0004810, partial [Schistosoma bovis]